MLTFPHMITDVCNPMTMPLPTPQEQFDYAKVRNAIVKRTVELKDGFFTLGTAAYMPYIETYATMLGAPMTTDHKVTVRRLMNYQPSRRDVEGDHLILDFIAAALVHTLKAYGPKTT